MNKGKIYIIADWSWGSGEQWYAIEHMTYPLKAFLSLARARQYFNQLWLEDVMESWDTIWRHFGLHNLTSYDEETLLAKIQLWGVDTNAYRYSDDKRDPDFVVDWSRLLFDLVRRFHTDEPSDDNVRDGSDKVRQSHHQLAGNYTLDSVIRLLDRYRFLKLIAVDLWHPSQLNS